MSNDLFSHDRAYLQRHRRPDSLPPRVESSIEEKRPDIKTNIHGADTHQVSIPSLVCSFKPSSDILRIHNDMTDLDTHIKVCHLPCRFRPEKPSKF